MKLRTNSEGGCKRPRPRAHSTQAFTLMELVVVLVLIAIMAAAIVPEMKGSFEDALLRSTGRELVDVFSVAYSRAVSLNEPHRVQIDPQTGRYLIEQRSRGTDKDFMPVKDVPGVQGELDHRIAIEIKRTGENLDEMSDAIAGKPADGEMVNERPEDGILFYPDGTADGCRIRLTDRAGFHLILDLNPVTARVHLVEQESK